MMSLALAHLETDNIGALRPARDRVHALPSDAKTSHAGLRARLPSALLRQRRGLEVVGRSDQRIARPAQRDRRLEHRRRLAGADGAELALEAGERARAKAAYELALKQWMGLAQDEKIGEVMNAVNALIDD